jgi:predicted metalloprotease
VSFRDESRLDPSEVRDERGRGCFAGDPDKWAHGSSKQRQTWFTTGYQTGDVTKCDTFGGSI